MRRFVYLSIATTMLVVYLVVGRGAFSAFFNVEESFPNLEAGVSYVGEVQPIPDIGFPGGGLLLEVPAGNNELLFVALLSKNISPEFYPLTYKASNRGIEPNSVIVFNPPQNIFGTYDCSLSASLASSGSLNGDLKCKNNTRAEFSLKRIQSVVKSVPTGSLVTGVLAINIVDEEDLSAKITDEAKELLSNVKNIDLSSAALGKEKEKLETLKSSSNEARALYSSAGRILEEVTDREREVKALMERRQELISRLSDIENTRQQLIRASGRGIEVQLAQRLTSLESAHFQKLLTSAGNDRFIPNAQNATHYDQLSEDNLVVDKEPGMGANLGDSSALEEDSGSSVPSPANIGKVEWWKQIE